MENTWHAPEVTPLTEAEGAAPEHATVRNGGQQSLA
jgi:hypothetical protein